MICQHCGKDVGVGGAYARHVGTCTKMPDKDKLARLYGDGVPITTIAKRYKVSARTANKWLYGYGIRKSKTKPGNAGPYFGKVSGCPCKHKCEEECRARVANGELVLCEREIV